MEKPLRIKILESLNDADDKEERIDLTLIIWRYFGSAKDRIYLEGVIDNLVKDGLIDVGNSLYQQLKWTSKGRFMISANEIEIVARITSQGEHYLKNLQPSLPTYSIQNSQGVIIGDGNHSLRLDKTVNNSPNNSPSNKPSKTPKTKTWVEKFWLPIWVTVIGAVVSAIIIGVILHYFPVLK